MMWYQKEGQYVIIIKRYVLEVELFYEEKLLEKKMLDCENYVIYINFNSLPALCQSHYMPNWLQNSFPFDVVCQLGYGFDVHWNVGDQTLDLI